MVKSSDISRPTTLEEKENKKTLGESKTGDFYDSDDFDTSDSEDAANFYVSKKLKSADHLDHLDQANEDEGLSEDEFWISQDGPVDEETLSDENNKESGREISDKRTRKNVKLRKLTPAQLEKEQKKIKRTGVCYLSRIPPYMKPAKLRSVLSRFGNIDRLFLKPEDTSTYHKRVKYGGNKKKNFTEGWVEFVNKKDAKMCASTLNANILGGKKTSYYYDDVINMKYLSGFKWFDLTQQIAKENEIRQAKLALEISQQQKLNKNFINNVEKSRMITGIKQKRKEKEQLNPSQPNSVSDPDDKIRRSFKQRRVTSLRADSKDDLKEKSKPNDKLNGVLSQVF